MALINCPECKKEISNQAEHCPNCGIRIRESANSITAVDYGAGLIGIPAIASVLLFYWVGGMNIFQNKAMFLYLIIGITIVGTALLAAMEASAASKNPVNYGKEIESPMSVFFGVALLWAIAYPVYLYKRTKFGLRNLSFGGVLVVLLFVFVSWLNYAHINEQIRVLQKYIN